MDQPAFKIAALYRLAAFEAYCAWREPILAFCRGNDLRGTLLLAGEGVNGTVAGSVAAIDRLVSYLEDTVGLAPLEVKFASADKMPFHRMKVRLKKEIVTMGVAGVDPARHAGTYVEPGDWNALIADPDTVVVDTRNGYEVALGSFAGAIDPATRSFRDFPAWAEARREELRGRKVAMFCTGGIRCEKATAYMRSLGIEEVFHLKGGILKYLEEVPAEESLWRGECFVFDERVSVGHGLAAGAATLCRACRHPLTPIDRRSPLYEEGVSCAGCHGARSEADRDRYRERHRQVAAMEARGGRHIGG